MTDSLANNRTTYVEVQLDHSDANPVLERLDLHHEADHWTLHSGFDQSNRSEADCGAHGAGGCRIWVAKGGPAWPLGDSVVVSVDVRYPGYGDAHYSLSATVPIQEYIEE